MGLFKSKAERQADWQAKKAKFDEERDARKAKKAQLGQELRDEWQKTKQDYQERSAAANQQLREGLGQVRQDYQDERQRKRDKRRNR